MRPVRLLHRVCRLILVQGERPLQGYIVSALNRITCIIRPARVETESEGCNGCNLNLKSTRVLSSVYKGLHRFTGVQHQCKVDGVQYAGFYSNSGVLQSRVDSLRSQCKGSGRFTEVSQFRPFLQINSNLGVLEGRIVSVRSQWKGFRSLYRGFSSISTISFE